jgi:hypothetical protein
MQSRSSASLPVHDQDIACLVDVDQLRAEVSLEHPVDPDPSVLNAAAIDDFTAVTCCLAAPALSAVEHRGRLATASRYRKADTDN